MRDFLAAYEVEQGLKAQINSYLEKEMSLSFEDLVEHDKFKSWWKCFICHNVYPSLAELLSHYRKRTKEFERLQVIKEESLRGIEVFDALYLNMDVIDTKLKRKLKTWALASKTLEKLNPLVLLKAKGEQTYLLDYKYRTWYHLCKDKK